MIDITTKLEGLTSNEYLVISYRFNWQPHLGVDQYGNFFMLPHCPNKRTIHLKQIQVKKDNNSDFVYYHRTKVFLSRLRNKNNYYKVNNQEFLIPYEWNN